MLGSDDGRATLAAAVIDAVATPLQTATPLRWAADGTVRGTDRVYIGRVLDAIKVGEKLLRTRGEKGWGWGQRADAADLRRCAREETVGAAR